MQTDVLIIGSGSAGISTAINLAQHSKDLKITVITKAEPQDSNTSHAQGGIAAVLGDNSEAIRQHIEDTLVAGDGLCDPDVVRFVVENAARRLEQIIGYGAAFDKDVSGEYRLGREGGHSQNIILHTKDATGQEVQRTLLEKVAQFENIRIYAHHFCLDLITEHHFSKEGEHPVENCFGVYALDSKTGIIKRILSKATIIASGGIGQVYQNTTNPLIATGDGIAMAYRAKAHVSHMEFVQFHPTALFSLEDNPTFLISEAVRGEGAQLLNQEGKRFMIDYDPRQELASRDIVARAIDSELKRLGQKYVWLDCRSIENFDGHFPSIYARCKEKGFDPLRELIPVVPAAHYICGGVIVDLKGRTNLKNLYACGECSNSGLHGANRLASNSLLEAIVYAGTVADDIMDTIAKREHIDPVKIAPWDAKGTTDPKELILISHNMEEVKMLMNDYVGIVRSNERLQRAFNRIKLLYEETEQLYKTTVISPQLCELRNLITIAYLIIKQSIARKENKGGFYNSDLNDPIR